MRSFPTKTVPESSRFVDASGVPIVIGYYRLTGTPNPLTNKVVWVDYSVDHEGSLCAYQWQERETILNGENCCCFQPILPQRKPSSKSITSNRVMRCRTQECRLRDSNYRQSLLLGSLSSQGKDGSLHTYIRGNGNHTGGTI
jgi:hypothetical protein